MRTGKKVKEKKDAGLGKRCAAYGIDLMIETVILGYFLGMAGLFYTTQSYSNSGNFQMLCFIAALMLLFIYFPWKHEGQTIGRYVMKIRIENKDGSKRRIMQIMIREAGLKLVFALIYIPVSLAYILFQYYRKKSFDFDLYHDIFFKTRVIKVVV